MMARMWEWVEGGIGGGKEHIVGEITERYRHQQLRTMVNEISSNGQVLVIKLLPFITGRCHHVNCAIVNL